MDKYKKYSGVALLGVIVVVIVYFAFNFLYEQYQTLESLKNDIIVKEREYAKKNEEMRVVKEKVEKIKKSIMSAQKKVYAPVESDLANETLFFTLYNDVIEMVHANKIKIRAIDYKYNPEEDAFVKHGRDAYFVCDVDMELVSNYVNLGKLIQDIYQYNYYIKFNSIDVTPYPKDKKILITKLSLRLYARTEPDEQILGTELAPQVEKKDKK